MVEKKSTEVIVVFDIGKTNKKRLVFNRNLELLHALSVEIPEQLDEDGFPTEDIQEVSNFVINGFDEILSDGQYLVKGVNFTAYGASLLYLNKDGKLLTPLYNYLKPYPEKLSSLFYKKYGGEFDFSRSTASPVLGSLNAGMQLYRLKYEQPEVLSALKTVLHLPQYIAALISGQYVSELTSIGCHTNLWDFDQQQYHNWLHEEKLIGYLPEITNQTALSLTIKGREMIVGTGLHDSSSALIPHLKQQKNRFLLLTTGTWCISLHPFNHSPLTEDELENDCLCYLQPNGKSVKAARFFGGKFHEEGLIAIAERYNASAELILDEIYTDDDIRRMLTTTENQSMLSCADCKQAYFMLMNQLVQQQKGSTDFVLKGSPVDQIIVDGGFANNNLFIKLLQIQYPNLLVTVSQLTQGSSLGAAMLIKEEIWKD
jgi:sugar (pentulose or hexulose) kinase